MKALGMIETKGLIPAIESADTMLKNSEVKLLEKVCIGAGLVTITVVGDVGAVKTAVDSGVEAIKKFGENILISSHVIPRPDLELKNIMRLEKKEIIEEKKLSIEINDSKEMEKKEKIIEEEKLERLKEELEKQKISQLRQKAKEYNNFGLSGRSIAKFNKNRLIEKIIENMGVIDDGLFR